MKYFITLLLLLTFTGIHSQNIAIYNAYINERPKVVTPIIGNSTNWGHEPNVVFELSYDIKEKSKIGIRYFYDDYFGNVGFRWNPSDTNIRFGGASFGRIKMTRFGVFTSYRLIKIWDRVSINGQAYFDYQNFVPQSQEPEVRTKRGNINGGGYTGPDRGEMFLTIYDKSQLLPSIGLSLSYRPFWKVVLHAEVFYSHGFVTHSRLEFEYTDLEVEQPTAEFIGNGTSFTYAFGLGFRLWE